MIRKRIYVLCIAETLILVFLSKVPFSSSLFVRDKTTFSVSEWMELESLFATPNANPKLS